MFLWIDVVWIEWGSGYIWELIYVVMISSTAFIYFYFIREEYKGLEFEMQNDLNDYEKKADLLNSNMK